MGSLVGCKLVGKVGLGGRGGVDWGLVVVVVVWAYVVVERVEASCKQGQEKLVVVGMGLELLGASKAAVKVVEGGREQAGAQGEGARRGGAGPGRG